MHTYLQRYYIFVIGVAFEDFIDEIYSHRKLYILLYATKYILLQI